MQTQPSDISAYVSDVIVTTVKKRAQSCKIRIIYSQFIRLNVHLMEAYLAINSKESSLRYSARYMYCIYLFTNI